MKYNWLISTVTIPGIEAAVGVSVLSLKTGNIVIAYNPTTDYDGFPIIEEITAPDGIEIDFASPLTPSQEAHLRNYLRVETRETLSPSPVPPP